MKRKVLWAIAAVAGVLVVWIAVRILTPAPQWRDGDLIFQTSKSSQSTAILAATHSAYTHMGILVKRKDGWKVMEAAGPVRETPINAWKKRGVGRFFAVFRRDLDATQSQKIISAAHDLMGRPYDLFFSFDNRAIYCSELPFIAYRKAGIKIGTVQKVGDLEVSGARVKKLIQTRWQRDEDCKGLDFDHCYAKIMDQDLVTPVSIARDPQFRQVYSNYPF